MTSFKNVEYEYCFVQFKNRFISSINSSLSLNLFRDFSLQTPIMYLAKSFVHSSSDNVSEIIFLMFLTISQFLTFHSLLFISLAFRVLNLFLICLRIVRMLDLSATSLRFCLDSRLIDWLYKRLFIVNVYLKVNILGLAFIFISVSSIHTFSIGLIWVGS